MAIRRTGSQTLVNRGVTAAAATPVNIITGTGGPTVNISSIQIANSTFVAKDDLAIDTAGGYMIINGTGFKSGAVVYIQGTAATSTSFVSSSQLNVTVPALSSGLLDVYVVNTDGSGAIYLQSLNANGTPSWTTTSPLTSQDDGTAFAINLVATGAAGDGTITYAVSAGSTLPSGTFLESNGYFYGTVSGISDETTYSFSVDAIDAQNQETARSFNITIRSGDLNFKNTVLLLNGETSNNTWITDVSANSFALTVSGDTRPVAFSPYETVWSNLFDGTDDYLTITANSAFNLPGDFTMECWAYWNSLPGNSMLLDTYVAGDNGSYQLYWRSTGSSIAFYTPGDGVILQDPSSSTIAVNRWHHIAVTRSGTTARLFVDGIQRASATLSRDLTHDNDFSIGIQKATSTNDFNGYISNVRLIKGTALYTSNFTPSTTPLTAVENTVLLTCQSPRLIDNSNNNLTITRVNNTSISNFGPFVETDLITGSAYFDGSTDFISTPSNAAFTCGTSDFTLEFWYYDDGTSTLYPSIFSSTDWATGVGGVSIRYNNSGQANKFLIAKYAGNGTPNGGSGTNELMRTTGTYPIRVWHHVAFVRSGNVFRIFVNGVLDGQTTSTESIDWNLNNNGAKIGGGNWDGGNSYIKGYISNLRLVKGVAVYTGNFTPPNRPLTVAGSSIVYPSTSNVNTSFSSTSTSLLTLQSRIGENNNRIIDLSGLATPITRSGNTSQGTFSPYQRGGWSNYFDDSGDYLGWSGTTLTGDFTVECWVYKNAVSSSGYTNVFSGSGNQQFAIDNTTAGSIALIVNATVIIGVSGTAVTLNNWHHLAWVREGSTCRAYVNGVQQGTGTSSASIPLSLISQFQTGGYGLNGYMSNVRIVNGTCLYPGGTTFTPSTTPLTPVANTALLTCADSGFIDDSPNNYTITRNGDVSIQPFSPFKIHTITANTHSVYFDGTGDYLEIPTNTALAFGTGDFTCESWVYITSAPGSAAALWGDIRWSAGYNSGWYTHINSNLTVTARIAGSWTEVISSTTINLNRWNHVAVSRQSGTFRLFVNGVLSGSTSSSTNYTNAEPFKVGIAYIDGLVLPLTGYISNLRAVKGVAVYTGNFALPNVAPLQLSGTLSANAYSSTTNVNTSFAAANTSLLTCSSNTIVDLSTANTNSLAHSITVNGDARPLSFNPLGFTATTIQGPSAEYSITNEGGSMFFDGNADFLKIDTTNILTWSGTTTFTVEGWFYQTAFDATSGFMNNVLGDLTPNSNFGDALYWSIGMNNSNQPGIRWYGGPTTCNATEALTLYRWNHVAWVVSSGVLSIYINGKKATLSGTSTITAAASSMSYVVVGADRGKYYSGYMSGLRVLKGTALYTSGFVPPAAPPLPIAGSSLLINGTNGSIIDYTRKNNLETVGDVKIRNNITKFGNTSMYFDGTGDYLYTPPASINDLVGDFTVEAWIYRAATGTTHSIVNIGDYIGASGILFYVTSGNALAIYTNNSLAMSGGTVSATTWTHVALVRSGTGSGNLKLYLNGTNVGTPVTNNSTFSGRLYVGIDFYNGGTATNFMNGYIDDLRITKGVARYTSNFSVPNKHPTN